MAKSFEAFEMLQLDALKEVGNIGAGNAATSLSKMLKTKIDMKVPFVKILPFHEIADYIGGGESYVVAVFFRVIGDAPGNMFFMMDLESARNLVSKLTGNTNVGQDHFDEMELSALQEIGNILAGSYLSSLADFTKLSLQPSVPALAIDMAMAILSYGLIEIGLTGDAALFIDTTFINGNEKVECHFFLIPDPPSLEILLGALGVPI